MWIRIGHPCAQEYPYTFRLRCLARLAKNERTGLAGFRGKSMPHTHECPRCGTKWECDDGNYQDECPYPLKTLCTKCWAKQKPEKPVSVKKAKS